MVEVSRHTHTSHLYPPYPPGEMGEGGPLYLEKMFRDIELSIIKLHKLRRYHIGNAKSRYCQYMQNRLLLYIWYGRDGTCPIIS
jgi:hypothetical protein